MTTPTPDPVQSEAQPEVQPGDPSTTGTRSGVKDPLRRSRTSGAWFAVVALGVLLLLLVIFVAQNTQKAEVSFLGWNGQAPLAVWMLIGIVGGILIAAVAGALRIFQLRRRVRSQRR